MQIKTRGIILNQIKHNDSSRIVNILTEELGKKSFIVFGFNNRIKRKKLVSLFQPLYQVSIEFDNRASQNLQKINDISIAELYHSIPFRIEKISILFFLAEIINKILKDELKDSAIFEFIWNSIQILDRQEDCYVNFHLFFLIKILKYLGFDIENNYSEENCYFDLRKSHFTKFFYTKYCLDKKESEKISELLSSDFISYQNLVINNSLRSIILDNILNYYSYHVENMGEIKTLVVLRDIFR